jgi:DNA-binding response OmpR family regulator
MICILLIEDDAKLGKLLTSDLQLEGYKVEHATNGVEGLDAAKRLKPDLIILDVMLPQMSGYEVCRMLRKERYSMPILMLTAKSQEAEKVVGLDMGADDYVVKPVGTLELHARIKALLRRHKRIQPREEPVQIDDLRIDFKAMTAMRGEAAVPLSAREFQILELFLQHEGEVVSRNQFLEQVWGYETFPTTRAVDNQILSLRQKLAGGSARVRTYIHTVHGAGYKFVRDA